VISEQEFLHPAVALAAVRGICTPPGALVMMYKLCEM